MFQKDAQHIKVGLFVFIALAVCLFFIFMIGAEKKVFQDQYVLKTTFSDISGLRVGAPVQLAGVTIGYVDNISFPKDLMKKNIEVVMRLSEKYKDRIREDSEATINTQGLLGDKFIFLSVGSADQPEIPNKGNIQSKEVVGLFALAAKGGDLLDNLEKITKTIADVFNDLEQDEGGIRQIVNSIQNILQETEKGHGLVHALIYDPEGQTILNNLSASMSSLRSVLSDSATDPNNRNRFGSIVHNLHEASENINDITLKINRGEGSVGGLINDPTIYNEIRELFGKANRNSLFKTVVRATLQQNDKVLK